MSSSSVPSLPKARRTLSHKNLAHAFARYTCKQVHRLDGLVMNTVDNDETDIAELVLKQYILALFHTKDMIPRLIRFGRKKFGGKRFVIAFQLGINEAVNTRNVPWAVVAEGDRDWEHLDWEPYDESTHIMVHLRVFYGREEDMQVAKLNIFPRIDGRDNDLTKDT
jgi:hypothetical protein